jgi:ABC-type glycerol-3-phosphate transport system permease component
MRKLGRLWPFGRAASIAHNSSASAVSTTKGAGELTIFWYVILPLVRPAIAGVAVLISTFVWNDYFWSLVLVQSDTIPPLTAGLQSLRGM